MIGIGVIVFVIGVAVVALILRSDDSSSSSSAADEGPQRVLVVDQAIPAGTTGDEVVAFGWAKVDEVKPEEKAPDALTSLAQLPGQVFTVTVPEGQQIRSAQVRSQNLRAGSLEVPAGMEALAVDVPFVPGGAGYVGAGDLVNVYGVYGAGVVNAPKVQRLLANVMVLDVSVEVAPRVASDDPEAARAGGGVITYLLAVDANAAEKAIFTDEFGSLYLTLSADDLVPVPTAGRTFVDVLS